MFEVNRAMISLKPTQAFVRWLNEVEKSSSEDPEQFDVDVLCSDISAYLITQDEAEALDFFIEANWPTLLELELSGWFEDTEHWPKEPTLALFNEWFEVGLHSNVIDLVEDDLSRESIED